MSYIVKTSRRVWNTMEEYQKELNGFSKLLHDLAISGTPLSKSTISYLLCQAETLGEYIGNFPTSHPIFKIIAGSPEIDSELASKVIAMSMDSKSVYEALCKNSSIPEEARIVYALKAAA